MNSELDRPIKEQCGKCDGSGSISWGVDVDAVVREADGSHREVPKACFSCNGVGYKMTTQRKINRRIKDRERRDRKRAEEAQRKAEEIRAERERQQEQIARYRAEWEANNPQAAQALTKTTGDFGQQMHSLLDEYGSLTEKQADALIRMAKEAPTAVCPEGRMTITGEIVSVKIIDTGYGLAEKVVVRDDDGFKVYGTLPKTLAEEFWAAYHYDNGPEQVRDIGGGSVWTRIVVGARVRFVATIEPSDDYGFGFYKRPAKAELVEHSDSEAWNDYRHDGKHRDNRKGRVHL